MGRMLLSHMLYQFFVNVYDASINSCKLSDIQCFAHPAPLHRYCLVAHLHALDTHLQKEQSNDLK